MWSLRNSGGLFTKKCRWTPGPPLYRVNKGCAGQRRITEKGEHMAENFVVKETYTATAKFPHLICIVEQGYLVCTNQHIKRTCLQKELPQMYANFLNGLWRQADCAGLTDLHLVLPLMSEGLGMDLQTIRMAERLAGRFLKSPSTAIWSMPKGRTPYLRKNMKHSATTRACVFLSIHREATELLMDLMEETGLKTMVRATKVNMGPEQSDILAGGRQGIPEGKPDSGWRT